jgi:hypothetical protein
MKISKINGFGSYGTIVEDIDLNYITKESWNEIKKVHANSLLTIIKPISKINYEKYYNLVENIGNTSYSASSYKILLENILSEEIEKTSKIANNFTVDNRFTSLQRVTALKDENNIPLGGFGDGELYWHSNNSGTINFVPGVALMGHQDMQGTATGFLQTSDYFESLSDTFKSELKEMVVVHNYKEGSINPVPVPEQELIYKMAFCPTKNNRIPLVIKSPSGIVGLHLGINTFDYIEGMSKIESNKLLQKIKSELFVEKYIYDYWWENNYNILLFDNSITLHRRLLSKKSCDNRIAYRIPFRYDSLFGDYSPYFQEEFNLIKTKMDSVSW